MSSTATAAQTPSQRPGPPETWEAGLAQYLQAQGSTPPSVQSQRGSLFAALKARPESAEAWWAFLSHEESILAAHSDKNTGTLTSALRTGRHGVTLFDLFTLATRTIPRQGNYDNKAYKHIWLGYARQQWQRSEDEARDTFKMLKSQLIGDSFAYLYSEWALLEDAAGNRSRALSMLNKGIASGAQPLSVLETAKADLEAGKSSYKPPFQAHSTAHSSLSTATAFLTPANGVSVRRKLPRSPTLELTATVQDCSTAGAVAPLQPFSAATVVIRKAPGKRTQENENSTVVVRSKTGHTTGDVVTGHSLSSEEATYTLHGNARGASPVTDAGRTVASTSSHGSADKTVETVTVKLDRSLLKEKATMSEEPTCVINPAHQQKKIVHRPLQSSFRGPRRIGLAGGASRVLNGEHTATQTLPGDGKESPQSSGEKRKAGVEASGVHVSTSHVSLANGAKRRLSPEPETKPTSLPAANEPVAMDHHSTVVTTAGTQREVRGVPDNQTHAAQAGTRPQPAAESVGEETILLQNSGLAERARDSIAPRMQGLQQSSQWPLLSGQAASDVPTMAKMTPAGAPPPVASNGRAKGDLEATQPLPVQPTSIKPTTPASAPASGAVTPNMAALRARPVPPPPPANYSAQRPTAPAPPTLQLPAQLPAAATQAHLSREEGPPVARPEAAGVPVQQPAVTSPPPPRPRQPLANLADVQSHKPQPPAAANAQEGKPHAVPRQRRVREDENMVMVRGTRYTKLECVGRGGSSKVYKVMAPNRKIVALKRIKLQGRDHEAAAGFIDEIALLQRLKGHSNIIQLIDAEVIQAEGTIYMVLEYGDIDLARLLAKHEKAHREGGSDELDENFIRLYWQQMLQAVHNIHEARIVHSDLKPANFLMVEGTLKLIDFGIAKAIQSDTTSIARESQVGTLNYMSPEAILGGANNIRGGPPMKVGRASDIWSLGCILYQMVHGHTPFSALPFIQKMHAITETKHQIAFPPVKNAALQDTLKRCLDRNPRTRVTMAELLHHPFLRPTAAPAPGLVGVTRSQLRKLLAQLSTVTASGGRADIDALSEELFRQLANGEAVDLAALVARPNPAAQPPASHAGGETAAQRKAPAAKAASMGALGSLHHDIKVGKAALRRVAPPAPATKPPVESALEARLREGIAKFRFDDTAGSSLPGEEGTTRTFSP